MNELNLKSRQNHTIQKLTRQLVEYSYVLCFDATVAVEIVEEAMESYVIKFFGQLWTRNKLRNEDLDGYKFRKNELSYLFNKIGFFYLKSLREGRFQPASESDFERMPWKQRSLIYFFAELDFDNKMIETILEFKSFEIFENLLSGMNQLSLSTWMEVPEEEGILFSPSSSEVQANAKLLYDFIKNNKDTGIRKFLQEKIPPHHIPTKRLINIATNFKELIGQAIQNS
ncbi:MAG: hypothetical protein H6621_03475 [Halobacteriovoraceae bacterium]|nr:hypothetical protein [Halobacteriovoraceae bacterium]